MSYKSEWFDKVQIEKIVDNLGYSIITEDLLDRDADNKSLAGGYGANIVDKLRRHPLTVAAEYEKIMEREYEDIKQLRIERRPYQRRADGLQQCSCGWTGQGTGYNGALIEGDRCPECGLFL